MWVEVFSTSRRTMEARLVGMVALGGAVGAVLRVLISEWMPDGFPYGTLAVNLAGSLLLGVIVGLSLSAEMGWLLGTGMMGAFTTMSAYSLDLVELFESGQHGPAAAYLLATLIGCPLIAYAGLKAAQSV